MKLSDKPLELKPLTVTVSLEALRASGNGAKADEMVAEIRLVSDMTNWTEAEILSLELPEWVALVQDFAHKLNALKETAIPPPTPSSSGSGATPTEVPSQSG